MSLPQFSNFLENALPVLQDDSRIVGVAAAGSWITGTLDEFSDLDLVIACEPAAFGEIIDERKSIAANLGRLLSAFTGEHVGEPRLLICLYDMPPILHVDLKFIALHDLAQRVENPVVLWERERRLTQIIESTDYVFPPLNYQWIEDRFWTWLHYGMTKVGRGELFEALDMLAFLRSRVLGPMLLESHGELPRGLRRIEGVAGDELAALKESLADYDTECCARALEAAANLYKTLRDEAVVKYGVVPQSEAEVAVTKYCEEIGSR